MEIPLQALVECTDGVCGRSVYVLINPVVDGVTHLVVREDSSGKEYIVPVEFVSETISGTIQLRCSQARLKKMRPFIKTTFIEEKIPYSSYGSGSGMYGLGSYYFIPYVTPEMTVKVSVEHKQIPPGELVVNRGTRVQATDGYIGNVDEFVVNPQNGHITHVVMREGYLWGRKDVIIPVSAMGDVLDNIVYLKLDKKQVESLPTFPVHRRWS